MKAAPYFAHAQFSDPAAILALPDPGDGIPYVKAMWHYARGVAQADADATLPPPRRKQRRSRTIERTADLQRCSPSWHSGTGRC